MNPLTVTEFLIWMKLDAVKQIQEKVKKAKISDVGIENIGITPSDSMSEIDEEIFLSMELSMYIEGVSSGMIDELTRTGAVRLLAVGERKNIDYLEATYDIIYTTSYNYESEKGTEYESGFSGVG